MQTNSELSLSRKDQRHFSVNVASTAGEVREAQRLRYQVFVEEMGARIVQREAGIEQDLFDRYCDHLIVRDQNTLQVVGTYRILNASNARRVGTYYAEQEFDLVRLQNIRPLVTEVGRACIHPEYRTGGVIMLLWSGLAKYMLDHQYEYLIGCASISMADGGANAVAVYRQLAEKYLAPAEYRVFPRHGLSLDGGPTVTAQIPALVKGYLRLGAWIGGEPAWDPDFNTADLFIILPLSRIESRYAKHYLTLTAGESSPDRAPLGA